MVLDVCHACGLDVLQTSECSQFSARTLITRKRTSKHFIEACLVSFFVVFLASTVETNELDYRWKE